ncbi:Fatty acid hydroxylase superfamily [Musa troglodytarum]|uniref:beta-carotene 3-hydroxylase n=1 Tax=Musa troglodytarum TaxID=320322 RepID=A0A9E7FRZ9_9LILI|nr:Fatty acid hydroxylase superfamily [Musa troglodytarum]
MITCFSSGRYSTLQPWQQRATAVCFALKEVSKAAEKIGQYTSREGATKEEEVEEPHQPDGLRISSEHRVAERTARKQSERRTYLIAAVMSRLCITSVAVAAVYYRFHWQMEGGAAPVTEMLGTFALSVGAAPSAIPCGDGVLLYHSSLWHVHESHHQPRDGSFELNDVFAIVNAVPTISLMAYGFLNRGLLHGLCFGAVSLSSVPSRSATPPRFLHFLHILQLTTYRAWGLRCLGWPTCSSTTG